MTLKTAPIILVVGPAIVWDCYSRDADGHLLICACDLIWIRADLGNAGYQHKLQNLIWAGVGSVVEKEGLPMKRILVADDGSEPALRAIAIAAEIAAKTGAELIAMAVIDPGRVRAADVAELARSEKVGDGEALERLVSESAAYLSRCRDAASRAGVARFRQTYRSGGDAALEITDFASAQEVDLIVVGCRGRGRLPGLLLGSVSQKLVSLAPCSVLVAR